MLAGDVPSAIDPPSACRFTSRCFRAIDCCRAEVPLLEAVPGEPEHLVACFNYAAVGDGEAE